MATQLITLAAESRAAAGKGPARALRRTGRVPAVVYGGAEEQEMISLEARALRRELHKARFFSTLYTLEVDGAAVRVLPRDVQLHPVSDEPIHADFVRVSVGASVTVEVQVTFLNEDISPGLKKGGVLNVVRREVELTCPADAIPAELTLDLAGADIGDSLHISQIALPEGVRPTITDRDFTIATISAPTVVRDEAEEEAEREEEEAAAREAEQEEREEE
jgi:large subunit ribosomal protein L25